MPLGWLLEAALAAMLLAGRDLYDHVARWPATWHVPCPRAAPRWPTSSAAIPMSWTKAGSLARPWNPWPRNFSDGLAAPLFWYLLLGLPGLLAYKAINTLDSMLGHRTPRYAAFGKAAGASTTRSTGCPRASPAG